MAVPLICRKLWFSKVKWFMVRTNWVAEAEMMYWFTRTGACVEEVFKCSNAMGVGNVGVQ